MSKPVTIIGAGLAGSEAAWQVARRGVPVRLYEMRPEKCTPAHHTGLFAELVCSNSLRARALENAVGLLKEEMRRLDSIIMHCADKHSVPAGGALAVDRAQFAACVTQLLEEHPLVEIKREECLQLQCDNGIVIVASGPLTSSGLSDKIKEFTGYDYFYFYDAVAPIVTLESIDMNKAFWSSRYGKGGEDYLNCPMNEEEYEKFWRELVAAERAPRKEFENEKNFEGCLPIEIIAKRGRDTMRYGPMKPVGLVDPGAGKRPHAVVQLRKDNAAGSLLNIVGFQTHLKWSEQKRVFRMIPGLENAEFVRYGVMHRNTYINSPKLLFPTYQTRENLNLFFSGQITGVEGYVESAASGLVAGLNAYLTAKGMKTETLPPETAHGALAHYITSADPGNFQPMNITFGLFPPLSVRIKDKKMRYAAYAARALEKLEQWKATSSCFS
ncbi:methylenetetrahydrofolate--tRNA-(uracil(54)-C(5))-methyltransferase (FADH(2)-oxidizing) TrmFO [Desulfotruncus alcoholivorax]|uniref:methylenetetrahydrofolate--tRNA-(uracil(54)- C(5))-methyltransferase (FADH(2)-oxidizing) TrmFO n=1 Tax=Desulfotruncus alcoholivorax TaxID=265477 RepID=UPI0004236670|nr:methylenetetrahydrofolate--tRNA-(uracil(54)-C(5))-methyltransferase (FADH(2)-oxidizing) TrmFO [Desulfotruncus alcoholivorax]